MKFVDQEVVYYGTGYGGLVVGGCGPDVCGGGGGVMGVFESSVGNELCGCV